MATADSLTVLSRLGLVQAADDKRLSHGDRFHLPDWLRRQVDEDCAALEESDAVTVLSESERTGKSAGARAELDKLEILLREGYRHIAAFRSTVITDAQRREVYAAYGWSRGRLGKFSADRTVALARLGLREHGNVAPKFRYPADLIEDLAKALAVYDALEPEANTGAREVVIRQRNLKLEAAEQTLRQVRHWYCAASRETSQSKELSRIGFQPRRKRRTKAVLEGRAARKQQQQQVAQVATRTGTGTAEEPGFSRELTLESASNGAAFGVALLSACSGPAGTHGLTLGNWASRHFCSLALADSRPPWTGGTRGPGWN